MEFLGNGYGGVTVVWEIGYQKKVVFSASLACLVVAGLFSLVGYWFNLLGSKWLLVLTCALVVCYILSQQKVAERVTLIRDVGVYIERKLVFGQTCQRFLPLAAIQGLCMFEAISQQCVVWMLGVVLGDGLLEPLFTAFQLTPAQIRQVYKKLQQHISQTEHVQLS